MTRSQVSLPDLVFFPLCLLIAAALVFVAVNPFADRAPRGPLSAGGRNAEDVTMKGRELSRFMSGDYGGVQLIPSGPNGAGAIVRLDRPATVKYEDPRIGPHIVLAEDVEAALASRPIEITIEARATGDFGASFFEADYFAHSGAESGWREFPLTREFAPYSFQWFPPRRIASNDLGYDYIGVRPVAPDKNRVMEIRSIRVRTIGPPMASPPEGMGTPTGPPLPGG